MYKDLALETLKHFVKNTDNVIVKDAVLTLHPELAESEDERVRKAIMGLTYLEGIEPILTKCSITAGDIRTYLEKQKEQKPAEWSEEDEDRFRNLIFLVQNSNEGWATKEGFITFIKRLKSLRPQPHWKPH